MLDSILSSGVTLPKFLLLTAVSIVLGILNALVFLWKGRRSQSLTLTLALLPAVVQVVIMLVNGSIGTGVAVAGAFSLVRFRSAPGNGREISAIFLAMALGLATGMGYLGIAILFFLIMAVCVLLLTKLRFGEADECLRQVKITIPENLDYDGLFDDLFAKYTRGAELEKVKTTNMGTLYELTYSVRFAGKTADKAFLDAIRCRNGNLGIVCGRVPEKEGL